MYKNSFLAKIAVALAVAGASAAYAGISATKHNLTDASGTGPNRTDSTEQICVFCHTPHGSNTGVSAPLWNKRTPSTTYTTYADLNSSSIDGEILSVGSVSLACLSCHDGTQAMDNIVNAPGSGGYDTTGGGATGLGYNWTQGADTISGVANLGNDLSNDHPIGIQYCGGGLTGAANTVSGTCADGDFVTQSASGSKQVQTKSVNSQQVFWVDSEGGTLGTREKTDIALYTRSFSGVSGPSVECASCHDPHVEAKGTDGISFMRVTTNGSKVCLACHVK